MKINKENISYKLFAIAVPVIIQNLVQYIQLQVDVAMLGHYNPISLSAVGNVVFPYNLHISFLLATSLGATILIAHSLGADDIHKAKRYSEVSFFFNTIFSVFFFIYLYAFTPDLLALFKTPAEVSSSAAIYMRILSYSFLLMGIEYSVTSILQGIGITKHIMYAGILRTIINIFLDWVLIYGIWGFPEMGIAGAALATTISNFFAAGYFVAILLLSKNIPFKISFKGIFKPDWKLQKENIKVGFPSGLESILWFVGQMGIIRIVNELDAYSSGLYVLIARIQAFTFFFYIGLARATMVMVGQKLGAGKTNEAIRITFLSLRYAFMLCVVIALVFVTIPDQILLIFTSDRSIINKVSYLLYVSAVIIFPVAVNVIIGSAIRGMKDTRWMFYTQSFGTTFIIGLSAIMIFIFHFNLLGVFIALFADETIRAIINFSRFNKMKTT